MSYRTFLESKQILTILFYSQLIITLCFNICICRMRRVIDGEDVILFIDEVEMHLFPSLNYAKK